MDSPLERSSWGILGSIPLCAHSLVTFGAFVMDITFNQDVPDMNSVKRVAVANIALFAASLYFGGYSVMPFFVAPSCALLPIVLKSIFPTDPNRSYA